LYDSTNANWGLNSGEQVYLIKLSANGDKLWTKAVGKTLRESINAIIETADGSLVLCGTRSESYVYIYDSTEGWVTKLSANGNEVWLREYEKKIPTGVCELSNGDLLVVTRNLDAEYDWRDSDDLDLMKFSSSGTLLWDKVLTP
jgi:outer membrane protein assembly factor BamB